MIKGETLIKENMSQILVPASSYDFNIDKRLLIPFVNGEKIGFINKDFKVIVPDIYSMYYSECYSKEDIVVVAKLGQKHQPGAFYYGAIDYIGNEVIPSTYFRVLPSNNNNRLFTLQNQDSKYSVIILGKGEIVNPDNYTYIDQFYFGYARVKIGGAHNSKCDNGKWGIIIEQNKVVLPIKYHFIQPLRNNDKGVIYTVDNYKHKEDIYLFSLK